jgi:hypothetical protein
MVHSKQEGSKPLCIPAGAPQQEQWKQLSSSHKAPLRSLSLQTLTQRVRHLRRWLYTCVPITAYPENSETCFATVLTCTSLKPLSVFTPSPTKSAKRCNMKEDITGVQRIAALPCIVISRWIMWCSLIVLRWDMIILTMPKDPIV